MLRLRIRITRTDKIAQDVHSTQHRVEDPRAETLRTGWNGALGTLKVQVPALQ